MKFFMTVLMTSLLSTVSLASVTKVIESEVQLYAGTSVDVVIFLEGSLRQEAIKACGQKENVLGLTDYTIKIGVMGASLLNIDVDSTEFNGPYVSSDSYPNGKASAKVVCKN